MAWHIAKPIATLHEDIEGKAGSRQADTGEEMAALRGEWPNKKPPGFRRAVVASFQVLGYFVSRGGYEQLWPMPPTQRDGTIVALHGRDRESELIAMERAKLLQNSRNLRGSASAGDTTLQPNLPLVPMPAPLEPCLALLRLKPPVGSAWMVLLLMNSSPPSWTTLKFIDPASGGDGRRK